MTIEDVLMKFVGLPAVIAILVAILCVKFISKKPYVIILFAILGLFVGLGIGYNI